MCSRPYIEKSASSPAFKNLLVKIPALTYRNLNPNMVNISVSKTTFYVAYFSNTVEHRATLNITVPYVRKSVCS